MWSELFSINALAIFFVWSFQGFGSRWFNVYPDPAFCLIADLGLDPDLGLHCDFKSNFLTVLRIRIRIHRIQVYFGLLDPDPNPLVRGMDPVPYHSIIKQNSKKNLDFYCFVTSFWLFTLKNDVKVPSESNMQKNCFFNKFFVGILKVNDENRTIRIH